MDLLLGHTDESFSPVLIYASKQKPLRLSEQLKPWCRSQQFQSRASQQRNVQTHQQLLHSGTATALLSHKLGTTHCPSTELK